MLNWHQSSTDFGLNISLLLPTVKMSDLSDFKDDMKIDISMIISQKQDICMDINSPSTSNNSSALTQPFKPPAIESRNPT